MKINSVLVKSPNDNYPDNTMVDIVFNNSIILRNEIRFKMGEMGDANKKYGRPHWIEREIEVGEITVYDAGTDNVSQLVQQTIAVLADGFVIYFLTGDDDFAELVETQPIPTESLTLSRHWGYWDDVTGGVEFLDMERGDDWEDDVYQLVHANSEEEAAKIIMG